MRAYFAGYLTVDVADQDEAEFVPMLDNALAIASAQTQDDAVRIDYDGVMHWSPICRVCGCTNEDGCDEGCAWVDGEDDLCTACVGKEAAT